MQTYSDNNVLMDRVQKRCSWAFEDLYRKMRGEVIHRISRQFPGEDRDLIESAFHDAMLECWRRPGRFDSNRANIESWLAGIARRKLIDLRRQRIKDDPTCERRASFDCARLTSVERVRAVDAHSDGVHQADAALSMLSHTQQAVLRYYLLLNFKRGATETIGRLLKMSSASVRAHKSRAVARLSKTLS